MYAVGVFLAFAIGGSTVFAATSTCIEAFRDRGSEVSFEFKGDHAVATYGEEKMTAHYTWKDGRRYIERIVIEREGRVEEVNDILDWFQSAHEDSPFGLRTQLTGYENPALHRPIVSLLKNLEKGRPEVDWDARPPAENFAARIDHGTGVAEINWVESGGKLISRVGRVLDHAKLHGHRIHEIRGYLTAELLETFEKGRLTRERLGSMLTSRVGGDWAVEIVEEGNRVWVKLQPL